MTGAAVPAGTSAETEQRRQEAEREMTRRRIAYALIGTLLVVVVGTLLYIVGLSLFGNLKMDALMAVMQTVGTTLLAPLVGLVGAVIGFYYGSGGAVQGAQTADQSTRNATAAATRLASEIRPDQTQPRTGESQQGPEQPSYPDTWPNEPVGR
jgi:hypothetical protein